MIRHILHTVNPIPAFALLTIIVLAAVAGIYVGYAWGWIVRGRSDADRLAAKEALRLRTAVLNLERSEWPVATEPLPVAMRDHKRQVKARRPAWGLGK